MVFVPFLRRPFPSDGKVKDRYSLLLKIAITLIDQRSRFFCFCNAQMARAGFFILTTA